jgi:hypothetical protein
LGVVQKNTNKPDPEGENENPPHHAIGLETNPEQQQSASQQQIQEGERNAEQQGPWDEGTPGDSPGGQQPKEEKAGGEREQEGEGKIRASRYAAYALNAVGKGGDDPATQMTGAKQTQIADQLIKANHQDKQQEKTKAFQPQQ